MKKLFQTYKSSILLLACMIIGAVSGYFWGEGASVLQPIADIFLNLLYCSIVPLIFVSLVSSIGKMKDLAKLRKVLLIMLVSFIITGIIASLYMVFVTGVFDPAKGTTIAFDKTTEEFTGSTNFLSMFTVNDFPGLLSRKNLMALMVFTIIFAISLVSIGEKGKVITDFMHFQT